LVVRVILEEGHLLLIYQRKLVWLVDR